MKKNDIISNAHRRLVVWMQSKVGKNNGKIGIYKYFFAISQRILLDTLILINWY